MPTAAVHTATEREHQAVIDIITLAFSTDPMARWAFPDPATYLTAMPVMIHAFGDNGFTLGATHIVEDCRAAAMWLPPGVEPDHERMTAVTEQHIAGERLDEMGRVFEQMAAYHPKEPCWFLPLIGVDPTAQGRGYGSALLRHALELCDRDGMPAYLESSNPRNIPLYERHGFERLGAIQIGSSPTLVPMLRRRR